jgi:hypothetical protein
MTKTPGQILAEMPATTDPAAKEAKRAELQQATKATLEAGAPGCVADVTVSAGAPGVPGAEGTARHAPGVQGPTGKQSGGCCAGERQSKYTPEEKAQLLKYRVFYTVQGGTLMSQADEQLPPLVVPAQMSAESEHQKGNEFHVLNKLPDTIHHAFYPRKSGFRVMHEYAMGTIDELSAEYRRKLELAAAAMIDGVLNYKDVARSVCAAMEIGYVPGKAHTRPLFSWMDEQYRAWHLRAAVGPTQSAWAVPEAQVWPYNIPDATVAKYRTALLVEWPAGKVEFTEGQGDEKPGFLVCAKLHICEALIRALPQDFDGVPIYYQMPNPPYTREGLIRYLARL